MTIFQTSYDVILSNIFKKIHHHLQSHNLCPAIYLQISIALKNWRPSEHVSLVKTPAIHSKNLVGSISSKSVPLMHCSSVVVVVVVVEMSIN